MKLLTPFQVGLILLSISSLSLSCKKGDVGPQGIQGEQGIAGEKGDKGDKGAKGDPGTANVIYSEWLDPVWNLTNGSLYKTMRVVENRLNDEFNEKGGVVLTFFRFQDNVVFQLPFTQNRNNNVRMGYAVYFADGGEVRFSIESTDGTALTHDEIMGTGSGVSLQFRYVLIPGGIAASARTSGLDFTDFKAVARTFDIPH